MTRPFKPKLRVSRNLVDAVLSPGNYSYLSRESGCSRQHIQQVLKGQRGVTIHAAKKIADAAGVTLDELYDFIKRRGTKLRPKGTRRTTVAHREQKAKERKARAKARRVQIAVVAPGTGEDRPDVDDLDRAIADWTGIVANSFADGTGTVIVPSGRVHGGVARDGQQAVSVSGVATVVGEDQQADPDSRGDGLLDGSGGDQD